MSIATGDVSTPPAAPNLERIVLAQVEPWLAQCHSFRQWYRQNFLLRSPTPEQEKLADEIQPWMIRLTRALLSQVLDPAFPYPKMGRAVEAVLWQLEEDWKTRRSSVTDAEADALLGAAFPTHAS